jgi:hypothetical protein
MKPGLAECQARPTSWLADYLLTYLDVLLLLDPVPLVPLVELSVLPELGEEEGEDDEGEVDEGEDEDDDELDPVPAPEEPGDVVEPLPVPEEPLGVALGELELLTVLRSQPFRPTAATIASGMIQAFMIHSFVGGRGFKNEPPNPKIPCVNSQIEVALSQFGAAEFRMKRKHQCSI